MDKDKIRAALDELDDVWPDTKAGHEYLRKAREILRAEIDKPQADRGEDVGSDEEIEKIAYENGLRKSVEHWGVRYHFELGSNLFGFARALLSRYGGAAARDTAAQSNKDLCALWQSGWDEAIDAAVKTCEAEEDYYQQHESMNYPECKSDAQTGCFHCVEAVRKLKATRNGN